MDPAPVTALRILKVTQGGREHLEDLVATEEPLALTLGYATPQGREQRELAVTMRTPGNDFELAFGFLFTEGIITSPNDVVAIRHCQGGEARGKEGNLLKVELSETVSLPPHIFQRHSFISSSCGVCGKASIEAVRVHVRASSGADTLRFDARLLGSLSDAVSAQQRVFGVTGGLHAAALFDSSGALLALREDVGRHNAVDKLLGHAFLQEWFPLREHILFLSGRASFELLQKAALAGMSAVCSVGAPSSLAVQCAQEFNITLAGFLRQNRFNLYSGAHRLLDASSKDVRTGTSC
jgi:FdhD protein